MTRHTVLFALLVLGANVTSASAQASAYRRTPGDSLRYQSTLTMTTEMEGGPTGPMQITMTGDTWMTVAFAPADTVRWWIEKASVKMSTPMGEMTPPMDAMLNKAWVARMSPNGKLEMITTPELMPPGAPGGDLMGLVPSAQIFL